MKFPFKDLRSWIEFLESKGQVIYNSREVEVRHEISAICKKVSQTPGPAVLHENISGYPGWRIFHDGLTTRERVAWAFGVKRENFLDNVNDLLGKTNPVKPKIVDTGPCKEVKIFGEDIDLTRLPIVFSSELEAPPYITAGMSNIRDPETGWQNTAIRRFQLKDKQRVNNLVLPFQHEGMIYQKYMQRKEPAPIAIVIGADPLYYLMSQLPAAPQEDEIDMWGAIAGEPLEVVRCETSDILVPASAEIILEGEMDPVARELEGCFPEFTGYTSIFRRAPIVNIKAVTMRRKAIYYYLYNGVPLSESMTIGPVMMEVQFYRQLKQIVPEVVDFTLLSNWGGVTVVSIDKKAKTKVPGLAKKVAFAVKTLKASPFVKNLVVVDDDIDVHDPHQVLWSLSTRFQGAKDINVIPGAAGSFLDPSEPWLNWSGDGYGYTSYTIFDCTEKLPPYDIGYRRGLAQPDAEVWKRIDKEWDSGGFLKGP